MLTAVYRRAPLIDGSRFQGQLPCLFCRHAFRRKQREEWRSLCGHCRGLTDEELEVLWWTQESDPDRVAVPPSIFRSSRANSDVRYALAIECLRAWRVESGARVLDIGCGISSQAEMFREFRYVGADINIPRLGFGARAHPWANYAAHDLRHLGFASKEFDAILCLEVIEHLPAVERTSLAQELVRVLRPGGLLILSTPDGRRTMAKLIFGEKCERSHEHEMTQAEITELFQRAGAAILGCREVAHLVLPYGKMGAILSHLVADRPRLRGFLARWSSRAGYRTLLYTATRS